MTGNSPEIDRLGRPRVAVLIPTSMRATILTPAAEADLASFAEVVNSPNPRVTPEELPSLLDGAIACITGWGTPCLDDELLTTHPELQLVAHTAGTVRRLVAQSTLERGMRLSHAAAIIGDAVAELVMTHALLSVRPVHAIDQAMKAGMPWNDLWQTYLGRSLGSLTIGVVGAGRVGRTVIRRFRAFGCRVLAYDPYLSPAEAADLGVEVVELDPLFANSDIVTLHAPVLPETRGMIGQAHLALLHDGAVFINFARAELVDEAALLLELRSGRISACLDVFSEEPLPDDSPMRSLSNARISPHMAGHTIDTRFQQGQAMVDEVRRFLRGEPLQYEITAAVYPLLA